MIRNCFLSAGLSFKTMKRIVLTIIMAAVAGVLLSSCKERSDDGLNREILIATVWEGEQFQSATSVEPFSYGDLDSEFFYIFGKNGILDVYPKSETIDSFESFDGQSIASLRYIYTPKDGEIVIEGYGLLLVKEISVDRLLLEGISGTLDLRFHSDINSVVSPPGD